MGKLDRLLHVFLCHDPQDKIAIKELLGRLKQEKWIEIWKDDELISLGQHRQHAIATAIQNADVVVVFLSKSSIYREGFIQRELRLVWDVSLEKPIDSVFLIPIRLDDCEIPQNFRTQQWGDYFGKQKKTTYEKLIKSLRKRFDQVTPTIKQPTISAKIQWFKNRLFLYKLASIFIAFVFFVMAVLVFRSNYNISNTPPARLINLNNDGTDMVKTEHASQVLVEDMAVAIKDKAAILKVAQGEFPMGEGVDTHNILVGEFWIDKYEVTNLMYRSCVQENYCNLPSNAFYFSNKDFDDYPVVFVSWNDALNYCIWAGRRLPTEAEWEKAASWDNVNKQKRLYPWGEAIDCSWTNFKSQDGVCVGHPVLATDYPLGKSPSGAFNMAGNVWEWTSSLFMAYPYDKSDGREMIGEFGSRVIRGGAWSSLFIQLQTSNRNARDSNYTSDGVGFRCALDG